ncbi:MAG: helix-turn-helix transcriptional regulator [Candidatus Limivivens sp.]|nr:helix-turn-helix transcriptional regulator [Candidatus Limivivens sp.]
MENRIMELRKERKLTQISLSTSIDVSQETISAYETGKHDPTAENLIRIADFFHVSIDYLLKRSDCRKAQAFDQLSDDEMKLIETFRKVRPLSRGRVLSYLQGFADRDSADL